MHYDVVRFWSRVVGLEVCCLLRGARWKGIPRGIRSGAQKICSRCLAGATSFSAPSSIRAACHAELARLGALLTPVCRPWQGTGALGGPMGPLQWLCTCDTPRPVPSRELLEPHHADWRSTSCTERLHICMLLQGAAPDAFLEKRLHSMPGSLTYMNLPLVTKLVTSIVLQSMQLVPVYSGHFYVLDGIQICRLPRWGSFCCGR